ncbi:TetR/AcrR family transcriptional regulator [Actinomadura rupiterrae]|uniref:TetR/AcrR family transcriptional regulator n=1 Tax=Actinomadura rupiterrae TaxID=559627 RepID=UPI0020A4581A|nr:TetR/AcrR family transcriptional regulator [Actinomadura rupiterrae]MCP2337683.1 AcrR family transcriptional regulator [Actinomadura rupiterrae]
MADRAATGGARRPNTRERRPGGARQGRRRLSVDERRDELIEAALELFSTRPPEDVSIDDVAAAAGASRALVYHYFGGKYELYLAALGNAARKLAVLLEPPTEGTPIDRLRISLERYFDFVESHAAGFTALLRGGPADRSGEVGEIVDGIRQLLLGRILSAMEVETPTPVLRITLRSWMASVETAGLDWLENRDVTRPELERLLVDQLIVLLHVAGQHTPDIAELFDRLAEAELGTTD